MIEQHSVKFFMDSVIDYSASLTDGLTITFSEIYQQFAKIIHLPRVALTAPYASWVSEGEKVVCSQQ